MKFSLPVIFLFFSCFIFSQPAIQWEQCFGGLGDDEAYSITQTHEGGYIVAGYGASDITTHGDLDFWIIKLSSTGLIEWEKSLGGSWTDRAYSIKETFDNGFIIAGDSRSNDTNVTGNHGNWDCWIVKTDSLGRIQWEKSFGGSDEDHAYSINLASDSGYILAGNTYSSDGDVVSNHSESEYWIAKLNSAGSIEWQNTYGGDNDDIAKSIQQCSDHGYIVAGYSNSTNGDINNHHGGWGSIDFWIVKLDSTGVIQWQKSLGGTADDEAFSVQQTLDHGYIVAGYTDSNDGDVINRQNGVSDFWIVKLDSTGIIQWQKSLGGTASDYGYSIKQLTGNDYIVTGSTYSHDGDVTGYHNNGDYWVVELDSTGTIKWQSAYGGYLYDIPKSIESTIDGGFIIAGFSSSSDGNVTGNHGDYDYWIMKFDTSTTTEINNSSKSGFDFQISPNPFSHDLRINFLNSNSRMLNIEITSYDGKLIKNLKNQKYYSEMNEVIWDGTNGFGELVNDGIYLISVTSEKFTLKKPVVFLKSN